MSSLTVPNGPHVFDGTQWIPIIQDDLEDADTAIVRPIVDEDDNDGSIFISIPSYRDGERCGETIKSIYENAKDPENVYVGIIEQNSPEDKFCLEVYCNYYNSIVYQRQTVRDKLIKVLAKPSGYSTCPFYQNIRLLSMQDTQARGPMYARSFTRKLLANEEYCLQIDAHTTFLSNWDTIAKEEWLMASNEFGIVTTVPPPVSEQEKYTTGGEFEFTVPRQCSIQFRDNGFPDYANPADGKVKDIKKPLLSHGLSSSFSFAKCHYEESVPYDSFSKWTIPIEQFSRYARGWTRGYDTYTPTRNIVFHSSTLQSNGHGNNEWLTRQKDQARKESVNRVKIPLQIPIEGTTVDVSDPILQANLGLYGIGKRRTLEQLNQFINMNLQNNSKIGNTGSNIKCTGHKWVPYDTSISPMENMYNHPNDLDPLPEYPLRTKMIFYYDEAPDQDDDTKQPVDDKQQQANTLVEGVASVDTSSPYEQPRQLRQPQRYLGHHYHRKEFIAESPYDEMPSIGVVAIFWFIGLVAWYALFSASSSNRAYHHQHQHSSSPKKESEDGIDKNI